MGKGRNIHDSRGERKRQVKFIFYELECELKIVVMLSNNESET